MTAASKGSPKEEEAIQQRVGAFVAAWNKHDPHGMAAVYADDADVINPFGRVAKSRSTIEAMCRDEHNGPLKDSRLSLKHERTRLLGTIAAISDHELEIAGIRDQSGKQTTINGHVTLIFQKHGDEWQVLAARPMIPAQR